MKKGDVKYESYIRILEKELVPAMGCTEPIALAYCAASCKTLLGEKFDVDKIKEINVQASPNIIKNVKSVIVPNTGGERGIEAAVAIGIVGGDSTLGLEVLSKIEEKHIKKLKEFIEKAPIKVVSTDDGIILNMIVEIICEEGRAKVQISNTHTNIVYKEKDDKVLCDTRGIEEEDENQGDYELLNVEDIYDFAITVDIEDIREVIERQIKCNMAISDEGLKNNYGANIGKVILATGGDSISNKAKASAAAGSDARMNGCELPVVINSGSGNQGVTTSVPVIVYGRELGVTEEKLIRALVLSNLVTTYQKTFIGRLSAFCGVVSAGAGASAGITYIEGGEYTEIIHSIVNTLAIASGMACDGAKSSCAAKIAIAVESGILGNEMYKQGQQFYSGDGLVGKGIEKTIRNIGKMGRVGMQETDKEIIKIMIEKS